MTEQAVSAGAGRWGEPRLVGREAESEAVAEPMEGSLAGEFRVALLVGGAGVGKTRLMREVSARYARRAIRLSARSYRLGTTSSFGPWAEALDGHLAARSPDEVRRLCGPGLGDLAHLLAAVRAIAPPADRPTGRGALLDGITNLLAALSAEGPVLVALDDLHLADGSSWEALRYLARRLSGRPIGILATARPAELRARPLCGEILVGLEEDGVLTRLHLPPLTPAEVGDLARAVLAGEEGAPTVPEVLVTWLVERSMGHPLFAISLLRALLEEGADLSRPGLERIPDTLRERVELDLGGLDPSDRRLLEVMAVIDQPVGPAGLAGMGTGTIEEVGASLERLQGARLVSEQGSGAGLTYEIVHPVVQDTIYQGIGGARRQGLHGRVAEALLAEERLGSAAAHLARAGERGSTEAVDALCLAMRQAEERGLYREALAVLGALVELLPPGDERWIRVLDAMAPRPEWVLGHLAEGDSATLVGAMRRIEGVLAGRGEPVREGAVAFYLGASLSIGAGRLEEAERACRRAIALLEEAGEVEQIRLARNELGWITGCAGDLPGQARLAGGVLEEALAADDHVAAIQAGGALGYTLGMLGRLGEGEERLRESIERAERTGSSYRAAWGRCQLGLILGLAGRREEAERLLEEALVAGYEEAADGLVLERLAQLDWLAGDLERGLARIRESAARRPIRGSRRRAWALALAARMEGEMGRADLARSHLARAKATYEGREILVWSPFCPWTEGFLAWQEEEPAGALQLLERAAGRLGEMGAVAYQALVLVDLAEVAARSGRLEEAGEAAGRLERIAGRVGGDLHPHLASLGEAAARAAEGGPEDTVEAARRSAEGLRAAGYRLYEGRAQEALGRALTAVDRQAAAEALGEAAETFDRCRAVWRRDRVVALLKELGVLGRRSAGAVLGPEALTEREREVVRLAARGYTAREIGDRLFISPRTVETHLANAYPKLGVGSKRDLIRRAGQLDL